MNILRKTILAASLLGAGAWLAMVCGPRPAQALHPNVPSPGALVTFEAIEERLKFNETELIQDRHVVYVPSDYGRLSAVLPHGEGYTLWFEKDGTLRNVLLEEGLFAISREGALITQHYERVER